MEESRFNFKFIGRLNVRCHIVNVKSPHWLRYKHVKLILKVMMVDAFNMH